MSQGLCPSCGAVANLTAEQTQTNCTYCGSVVIRQEAEAQFNAVKSSKFGGTLMIAETAQEGGGYEEALNYYNKVIEQEPAFADAWLNKGTCLVRTSKIGDLKIPEAVASWKAAIKFAANPEAMKKRVALEINSVVVDFYPVLESHYLKFRDTGDAISEHVQRFLILEKALSLALNYNSTSRIIAENGVALCDRVVQSVMHSAAAGYAEATAQLRKDHDMRRAHARGAAAKATGEAAVSLTGSLSPIKEKYQQALFRIDPSLREAAIAREKADLKIKEGKEVKRERAKTWRILFGSLLGAFVGCGWFIMGLQDVLAGKTDPDHPGSQWFEIVLGFILGGLSILAFAFCIKELTERKKVKL